MKENIYRDTRLLCPNCRLRISPETLTCSNQHRFRIEDGVLILLEENFARELNTFLSRFTEIRRIRFKNYLQPQDYPFLPFGKAVAGNMEWQLRQYDLEIILAELENRRQQSILELGGYNGWLTHRLAALGHNVTAVDYFIDEPDGLKTRKYYQEEWKSIQMDIRDLSLLEQKFDVIILNRCLQFFENPVQYFKSLKEMLGKGGIILLTGLQIFKNPRGKIEDMQHEREEFLKKYGFNFLFVPFKGYLDAVDKQQLLVEGVHLKKYSGLKIANFRAWINSMHPVHYYGIFQSG